MLAQTIAQTLRFCKKYSVKMLAQSWRILHKQVVANLRKPKIPLIINDL
jgi:hypothetical protein